VTILNAFDDNYIFLLACDATQEIAVVDPGDADVVIQALGAKKLSKIFVTHHHHDHVGGIQKLVQKYKCEVVAFRDDAYRIPCVTQMVEDGEGIHLGLCAAKVIYVPGHTMGHIAYYFADDNCLFCGDALFVGGCGRLFEGTADMMFNYLVELKSLPDSTLIYCAHEYTVSNLKFARHVKPENIDIQHALKGAEQMRALSKRTVPSTIKAEKLHNVFLQAVNVTEFKALRLLKDNF
tara:strand:- start:81974 stop:82681 length:708 start_codon:yes stop_codon:yes gene_type:complete